MSGYGELTVKNGNDYDAVIALTGSDDKPRLSFYVRANMSFNFTGIPDGVYSVYYALGEDWDSQQGKFTRNNKMRRFDDKLDYKTTASQYTTYELSIYSVPGGNASTEPVDESKFPKIK